MTFNHDKNPFKRRMCIQEYHCMYSLGGEVSKMTCNRDKNSLQAKDVHSGIPLHVGLWGGSLENDLQS